MSNFLIPGKLYNPKQNYQEEGSNIDYIGDRLYLKLFYSNPSSLELQAILKGTDFKIGGLFINNIFLFVYNLRPLFFEWGDVSCSLHNLNKQELNNFDYNEPPHLIEIVYGCSTNGIYLGGNKIPLSKNLKNFIYKNYKFHINNYLPEIVYFNEIKKIYNTYTTFDLLNLAIF